MAAALEGREWWLQLQRQRGRHPASGRSNTVGSDTRVADGESGQLLLQLGSSAGLVCSPAAGQQDARRLALMHASQVLLRHMAGSRQQLQQQMPRRQPCALPADPSCECDTAAPGGPKAEGSPQLPASSLRLGSSSSVSHPDSAAVGDSQHVHMQELLQYGLIGRATQASAAWKAMQRAAADREGREWRAAPGTSYGSDGCTTGALASSYGAPGTVLADSIPALGQLTEEVEEKAEDAGQPEAAAWTDGTAEELLAGFQDAEVRQYLRAQFDVLSKPDSRRSSASSRCAPADGAAGEGGFGAGAGVGEPLRDPLLQAWMVTRAPPDFPVRGWQSPPGRIACKIHSAAAMQDWYTNKERRETNHFKMLNPTRPRWHVGGKPVDRAATQLEEERAAAERAELKRLQRHRARHCKLQAAVAAQELMPYEKAAAWAIEHAQEVEVAAVRNLQEQKEQEAVAAAAAKAAAAAAAAAAMRRAMLGDAAGAGFAAVVRQAREQQKEASGVSSSSSALGGSGSRRSTELPALQLQRMTLRWQRAAAATGGQSARARREAAARQELRDQWEVVRQRLRSMPSVQAWK